MKRQKLVNVLLILLPLLAVFLTTLPNSFMMRFFAGGQDYYIEYVSGFAPILLGYGNWGPMLAGVLSAALAAAGIFSWKKKPFRHRQGLAITACVLSCMNLFGGITIYNLMICCLLLAAVVVGAVVRNKKKSV